MQKRISALLAALCLCLLLTACGGNDSISGEVVDIHQTPEATALILQTDGDKRIAVFLDEDTYVFGMDEIDGEAYKAAICRRRYPVLSRKPQDFSDHGER